SAPAVDAYPVPVPPHAGIHVEVAVPVALASGVVPEEHRHRRHRLGDHQLALFVEPRPATLVERLHLAAQTARLDLADADGQPVEVCQNSRSPGLRSVCRASFFICSSTTPPWPWTRPFGRPVVPEE